MSLHKTTFKTSGHWLLLTAVLFTAVSSGIAQEITKIKMVRNLPLVKGKINDKDAYFIIDTGASVTLLNNGLAEEYGFTVVQNDYWENYAVTGIGGKHLIQEARNVVVQLGDQKLAFLNKTCSLQRISRNFLSEKITIAGIIGSDVLGALGSEINFSAGYIVFYHEPVKITKPAAVVVDLSWSKIEREKEH